MKTSDASPLNMLGLLAGMAALALMSVCFLGVLAAVVGR